MTTGCIDKILGELKKYSNLDWKDVNSSEVFIIGIGLNEFYDNMIIFYSPEKEYLSNNMRWFINYTFLNLHILTLDEIAKKTITVPVRNGKFDIEHLEFCIKEYTKNLIKG